MRSAEISQIKMFEPCQEGKGRKICNPGLIKNSTISIMFSIYVFTYFKPIDDSQMLVTLVTRRITTRDTTSATTRLARTAADDVFVNANRTRSRKSRRLEDNTADRHPAEAQSPIFARRNGAAVGSAAVRRTRIDRTEGGRGRRTKCICTSAKRELLLRYSA